MNILIIRTNVSDFGKIGTYNVQEVGLAESLMALGHGVKVIYLYKNITSIETDSTYSYVHYFPSKRIGLHGFFDLNLFRYYSFDSIILFSDNQMYSRKIIHWALKAQKKICVYWGAVLSTTPKFINKFYTFIILLTNWSSYQKSINIAKTSKVQAELHKFYIACNSVINVGLDKKLLNNNSINIEEFKSNYGIDRDDKIILFVGRFEKAKQPLFALEILRKATLLIENLKLIMIGDGSLRTEIENYIDANNLRKNVILIGKTSNEIMHVFYKASDVFINLSNIEIFGMAMLESMYYGTPVVAMNAPGPNEFIKDGYNGYIMKSLDLNTWVDMILHLINTSNDSIISEGKKTINDDYLWDSSAKKFIECLTRG